jgi:hypothetical protein
MSTDLNARERKLIESIQTIESQLSKDGVNLTTGEQMSDEEFREWRGRALTAKKHLAAELREVKAQIKQANKESYTSSRRDDSERLVRIEEKLDLLLQRFDDDFGEWEDVPLVMPENEDDLRLLRKHGYSD